MDMICLRLFVVLSFASAQVLSHRGQSDVTLTDGCAQTILGDTSYSDNPSIPPISWLQTPAIYEASQAGHYVVRSRVVHLRYLKEQLQTQKQLGFEPVRQEMNLVSQLDIQADAVYIEGVVALHGINTLKIYAREIVSSTGGRVDVSAPNWDQQYQRRVITGEDGEDGEHGVHGPRVEIYTDIVRGALEVVTNGGDGHRGQDGGNGEAGRDSGDRRPDKPRSVCHGHGCRSVRGEPGIKGPPGGDGGDAGNPGRGGNAGSVIFHKERIEGKVTLRSCRGSGGEAARNGEGGQGGNGGLGGKGWSCYSKRGYCFIRGQTQAPNGPRGDQGNPGITPDTPGQDGEVGTSAVTSGAIDVAIKESYPMALLQLMKRQAEDVLLVDPTDAAGRAALTFIHSVSSQKSEPGAAELAKAVRRKLAFVGKEGYDIFGNIALFAPRIKWEKLEDIAEDIKQDATAYENAYNDIMNSINRNDDFRQLAQHMSAVSEAEVKAEKDRLVEARNIAESEKRLYVKSIKHQEERMTAMVAQIEVMFKDVYSATKFNGADLLAVLQGLVGFSKGISINQAESKRMKIAVSPLDIIDAALGLASSLASSSCLGSLSGNLAKIKRWLQFGEHYEPLEDSSDLDFDQLDVSSVPEIMKSNLEMNKEGLTAQLVCMLEVKSRPQDVAGLKQYIESFFIAGSARIDLIGKVMDLDNDIGGLNFDIPLLEETQQYIIDIGNAGDAPISEEHQLGFLDSLLSTYREMERSFMKEVYELHKAFKFRTLWEGNDPLATFQRVATESAQGTGRLNGIVELTKVLRNFKRIETKAVRCFTNNIYTTDIKKWSFDSTANSDIFQELVNDGYTKLNIGIDQSCDRCYNVRLLKLYIELTGEDDQPSAVPDNVHLQVRHMSGSYFLAGNGNIKEYRQPVGSPRQIKFDRFSVSDAVKCREEKRKGNTHSSYCVTKTDSRWHSMCNNPLARSTSRDSLLGEEECKSPFGTYEIAIPRDQNLQCSDVGIKNRNCKDLDVAKFTKMNVWGFFFYWSDNYPVGPEDPICRSPRELPRNPATTQEEEEGEEEEGANVTDT